jgi:hypothetical protein
MEKQLIKQHRVTDAQFVPAMFGVLRLPRAERDRYDLSSRCTVLHTAAPCPVTVKRQMLDGGARLSYPRILLRYR